MLAEVFQDAWKIQTSFQKDIPHPPASRILLSNILKIDAPTELKLH